jgi:ankyrin repeat protein
MAKNQNHNNPFASLGALGAELADPGRAAAGFSELGRAVASQAMVAAAKAGDTKRVQAQLDRGASPLWTDSDGHDALDRAIEAKSAACVKLLAPLSNLGGRGSGKVLLLWVPILEQWTEGFEILLPLVDAKATSKKKDTALMHAAESGWAEAARRLLPLSDAKARNVNGETALMKAAAAGSIECVEALIGASDPLAQSHAGLTALTAAAAAGSIECVRLLLPVSNPGAVLPGESLQGSALRAAIGSGSSAQIAQLIYDKLPEATRGAFALDAFRKNLTSSQQAQPEALAWAARRADFALARHNDEGRSVDWMLTMMCVSWHDTALVEALASPWFDSEEGQGELAQFLKKAMTITPQQHRFAEMSFGTDRIAMRLPETHPLMPELARARNLSLPGARAREEAKALRAELAAESALSGSAVSAPEASAAHKEKPKASPRL